MYEFLKQLCEERNTNISKLCTEVTGNSGNLATWKKGYMRSDYLLKCADVLGVTTDYILQRDCEDALSQEILSDLSGMQEDQKKEVLNYIKFVQQKG